MLRIVREKKIREMTLSLSKTSVKYQKIRERNPRMKTMKVKSKKMSRTATPILKYTSKQETRHRLTNLLEAAKEKKVNQPRTNCISLRTNLSNTKLSIQIACSHS